MNAYCIYSEGVDWHVAAFRDKDSANEHFRFIRKRHPCDHTVTETVDSETGAVLSRKVFGSETNTSAEEIHDRIMTTIF